jgi:hypothetical protein
LLTPRRVRHPRTFEEHVEIISKMVTGLKRDSKNILPLFQKYVLAVCAPKILFRLGNKEYSKPFVGYLNDIKSFTFVDAYPKESTDELLWKHIRGLATAVFPGEFKNLLNLRNSIPAGSPRRLYTAETCHEFHSLLCRLLESFEKELTNLTSSRDPTTFSSDLEAAALVGRALWSLIRSGAFESHMHAIRRQLQDTIKASFLARESDGSDSSDGSHGGEGHGNEGAEGHGNDGGEDGSEGDDSYDSGDIELRGVQPYTHQNDKVIPLWKSVKDWLLLMVAHLDAVEIIHRYVKSDNFTFDDVSIRVIPAPPVSKELLPWDKLLGSDYFPEDTSEGPSTQEIIKFFKDAVRKTKAIKQSKANWDRLVNQGLSWCLVTDAVDESNRLRLPQTPRRNETPKTMAIRLVKEVIKPLRVKEWKDDPDISLITRAVDSLLKFVEFSNLVVISESEVQMKVHEITQELNAVLRTLSTRGLIDKLIQTENGQCFEGTEHCEARLGALITYALGSTPGMESLTVRCFVLILLHHWYIYDVR